MEVDIIDLEKENRLDRMNEKKRIFMTRKLCKEILEEILMETATYRVTEMATNVMERMLNRVIVEATVNKLLKEAEGQGHEVVTELEERVIEKKREEDKACLLYTSPSPRDVEESRMPSSA